MTREECDVDEQDVDERKECWGRKRVLSYIWVISESYLSQTWCELIRASALFSLDTLVTRWGKKKRKRERKQSWRVDINNLALALFMLISTVSSRHFYTDAKALKKSWLRYQLQKDNTMLWRLRDRVFKKECSCENASHRLWTMRVCETSSRD